jgi:hypothetical protein
MRVYFATFTLWCDKCLEVIGVINVYVKTGFHRWLTLHPAVTPEERDKRTSKLNSYLTCDSQPDAFPRSSDHRPIALTSPHTIAPDDLEPSEPSPSFAEAPLYASLGAVARYEGGDLAKPGVLQEALMARSFDNEVCLLKSNGMYKMFWQVLLQALRNCA